MLPTIDYGRIARAIEFFGKGYQYIEVPWAVDKEDILVTYNPNSGVVPWSPGFGHLVGSSEQSFLHLQRLGKLPRGHFMACSPCFRLETVDELHQKTFMKVELHVNEEVCFNKLCAMIDKCLDFFTTELGDPDDPPWEVVKTEEGYDIELNGIEIGSYGIREHNGYRWIYGTALAEPRFSIAKNA